jgi:hypothetical protein
VATATSPNPQKQDETSDTQAAPAAAEAVPPAQLHAVSLKDSVLPAHAPGAAVDPDDLVDTAKTPTLMDKVQEFRSRHEKWEMALFFFGGFLYDVLSLSRIDDTLTLVQNFGYLVILTTLFLLEQRFPEGTEPPKFLAKVWRWREDAVHFLFGSLLSVFMLLLFKSTSGFTPYLFIVGLFALLVANELPRFRQLGPVIRVVLLSLCVTMYFACLLPVVTHRMGFWVFLLAVSLGCANVYGLMRVIQRWRPDVEFLKRNVAVPGFGVQGALLALYLVGGIPPLPLVVQYSAVYHDVKKAGRGEYQVSHVDPSPWKFWHHSHEEVPAWKFWRSFEFHGDHTFRARSGDKAWYFFRIFSPKNFQDYRLRVRWYYDHPEKGWTQHGNGTLLTARSSTEAGFRSYAYTSNPKPGDWRVVLETESGHEISRSSFTVVADESTEPRQLRVDVSKANPLEPVTLESLKKAGTAKPAEPSAKPGEPAASPEPAEPAAAETAP